MWLPTPVGPLMCSPHPARYPSDERLTLLGGRARQSAHGPSTVSAPLSVGQAAAPSADSGYRCHSAATLGPPVRTGAQMHRSPSRGETGWRLFDFGDLGGDPTGGGRSSESVTRRVAFRALYVVPSAPRRRERAPAVTRHSRRRSSMAGPLAAPVTNPDREQAEERPHRGRTRGDDDEQLPVGHGRTRLGKSGLCVRVHSPACSRARPHAGRSGGV